MSNLDCNGHLPTQNGALRQRIYQPDRARSSASAGEAVESGQLAAGYETNSQKLSFRREAEFPG
jgi:hypothetical protein